MHVKKIDSHEATYFILFLPCTELETSFPYMVEFQFCSTGKQKTTGLKRLKGWHGLKSVDGNRKLIQEQHRHAKFQPAMLYSILLYIFEKVFMCMEFFQLGNNTVCMGFLFLFIDNRFLAPSTNFKSLLMFLIFAYVQQQRILLEGWVVGFSKFVKVQV